MKQSKENKKIHFSKKADSVCLLDNFKVCNVCTIKKDLTNYHRSIYHSLGRKNTCKVCVKGYTKDFYEKNKESSIATSKVYIKERRKRDPLFRLRMSLRNRIGNILREKSWDKEGSVHLGCSLQTLKIYIENQFQPGMTWENFGKFGWHIDHIKPLSLAKTSDELLILAHHTNLQPLWALDNLSKGSSYDKQTGN